MTECYVCSSNHLEQYFSDGKMSLLKCGKCGLKFQHPMPTPEYLAEVYSSNYYDSFYPERILGEQKLLFDGHLQELEGLQGGRKGRVLDIGSGQGMFLQAAKEREWDCEGQECSEAAAQKIEARLGIRVSVCNGFEQAGFPEGSFDLVHMNHVLEHLYDPVAAAREVHRILKPGGLFYCEVPRQSNLLNKLTNIFRKTDFGFTYLPEHLFLFDTRSFRLLLERVGFTMLAMRVEGLGNAHRYTRGVHYHSLWTHMIVKTVGTFRLQNILGGGNLLAIVKKPR